MNAKLSRALDDVESQAMHLVQRTHRRTYSSDQVFLTDRGEAVLDAGTVWVNLTNIGTWLRDGTITESQAEAMVARPDSAPAVADRIPAHRRTNWNALLLFGNLGFWLGSLAAVGWACIRLHQAQFPDETHASGAWMGVTFFAVMFGTAPVGLFLSNTLAYMIPPARRALEREAIGRVSPKFFESQRGLVKLMLFVTIPCFVVALLSVRFSWR